MSTGRSASRTWGRGAAVVLMLAIAALLAWLLWRGRVLSGSAPVDVTEPAAVVAASALHPPSAEAAPLAPGVAPRRRFAAALHSAREQPTAVPADPHDGMYAGPGPDDPAGPGMLPHPITPEHVRIYRDVELLDGAWQALKRRDFEQARVLLRQHAAEYGTRGYDDLNDGLTLLADCMERPGPETRQAAQRFYDQQTASTARKRLRMHCLKL